MMQHIKSGVFADEVNFEFLNTNFSHRETSFMKTDEGIQILQLKKDKKSYCFLYVFLNFHLRKPTPAKPPLPF